MKKKVISLLMVVAMVITIVGCGKDSETKKSATNEVVKESGSDAVDNQAFFPLKDQVTVKMYGKQRAGYIPFADKKFYQELEEKTNLHIDWVEIAESQATEKIQLAFAGGELPDALYGNFIIDTPLLVKYGTEGWLMPLNKYITPEIMPNFCAFIDKAGDSVLETLKAEDGNIYGLPSIDESSVSLTSDTLLINSEWLEKVGKEMPTTIDEFYEVLVAFKEAGDLNGNGKNDEIPFTFRYGDGNAGQFSFMGFTGLTCNNQHQRMARKDGEVVYYPIQDEYKEFLEFMNRLYTEGLVDPEIFTMDTAAYNAKTKPEVPTCGVMIQWAADYVNATLPNFDETTDGVYQYLAPLKGNNGKEPTWIKRYRPYNINMTLAISADTEYAEEIARWADLQYDSEASIASRYGEFGVNVEKVSDGLYKKLTKPDGSKYSDEELSAYGGVNGALGIIYAEDFKWDEPILPQSKLVANEVYGDYIDLDFVDSAAMLKEDQIKRSNIIMTDLNNYVDQMSAKFITEGNIEEGWEAYIEGVKKYGADEFVEIWTDVDARSRAN